jgi:hypothetical protein
MPKLRGHVNRQQFPAGRDGQVLVLETASPNGIAWRSGIDRLITDITPELAGDLDCQGFDLTGVGNIGFSAVTGTLAGIENQNLLDKSAAESIAGIYTHNADIVMADNSVTGLDTLTFTDTAGTIAGVQNGNLVDKAAGAFTADVAMGTNQITGLGTPSAATDAATKGYVDGTLVDRAYLSANYDRPAVALNGLTANADNWVTPTTWVVRESENWTHSSGEFEYTGSGTRQFLVSWSFSFTGWSNNKWWRMKGRITQDTGTGHVVVPGSVIASQQYAYYSLYGVFVEDHILSGSAIIEVSSEDKISLDFGNYCANGAISTFNVGTLFSNEDGFLLTITPADNRP